MTTRFLDWTKQSLRRDSLRVKLITFFFLISLTPLLVVGVLAFYLSQSALRDEAFDELELVRDLKSRQIQSYFEGINNDIRLLSSLPIVNSAMTGMMNVVDLDTIRGSGFLGQPDLNEVELTNLYSLRHAKYHPFFTEVVNAKGYLDVFLVDLHGNIVYSQAKNDDFATNLLDGLYSDTELAQVFKQLQFSNTAGEIYMTDHTLYPTTDNPLSFVGTPIIDETLGQTGVLIYAVPLDQIAELVQDQTGIGDRNIQTYLVGQDKKLRSTNSFPVDTRAVRQGLEGITGREEILNSQNEEVFSAYQPIEISGQKWVLLVEESKEDAIAPANILRNWILVVLMAAAIAAIIAGLLVGSRIASPISRLTEMAQQVTGGDLNVRAQVDSQDEIGELAEVFNIMTNQLRQSFSTLEEQVQERTGELALSLEVGQRVANIRNMDILLSTVIEFIWDQFNLFYVQVFLVDDINQNLVLRTGTGQAGQELLARNLSMPINPDTTVGRSVVERQSIVVGDTTVGSINTGGQNIPAAWYSVLIEKEKGKRPASLLPETLSELAIPLVVEGQVLGVLDLQDDKVRSFTEKDLSVYEAIAVQLSVSIDSARQWELAQQAQKRAEQAVRQLTREGWADRLVSSWGEEGYVYDLSNVSPLSDVSWVSNNNVSVPLMVQDQAIGQLNVNAAERDLTGDEQALLQAVAQQLAQKAENLRLFEATQQRASREQIARRIIDKIRASRNIETALQTAVEELNKALGTARAVVDLQVASNPHPIPVGEQDADFAEIASAEDVSADDDGSHEALSLRRYGHSGLL